MKNLIYILLFLTSCSKEPIEPKHEKPAQFTAVLSINPNLKSFYVLYVSNDSLNRNDSFMINAGTFKTEDLKNNQFGFDFKEYRCNDFVVTPGKRLYGALRENAMGKLIYNSVSIK